MESVIWEGLMHNEFYDLNNWRVVLLVLYYIVVRSESIESSFLGKLDRGSGWDLGYFPALLLLLKVRDAAARWYIYIREGA